MVVKLTIHSYRSFHKSDPATLLIEPGFTALTGPNNAGKSNVLRFFYEMRGLFGQLTNKTTLLQSVTNGVGTNFNAVRFQTDPYDRYTNDPISFELEVLDDDLPDRRSVSKIRVTQVGIGGMFRSTLFLTNSDELPIALSLSDPKNNGEIGVMNLGRFHRIDHWEAVFAGFYNTIYVGPARSATIAGGGMEYDIRIGSDFIREWVSLKTGEPSGRATARSVEALIASLIDRSSISITADAAHTSLVVDDSTNSFHIDELGAGLEQLVIVLINIANRRPAYVLIDEPEAHLHARLQRLFLAAISKFEGRGVIYTTHNYGLARTTAHNAYSVTMNRSHHSVVRPLNDKHRLAELLGSLNYVGYQETGFDAVLMVEGVNDVLIVQELLTKMGRGGNVLIMPFGGDNIYGSNAAQALHEMARISSETFIMIDSDREDGRAELTEKKKKLVAAANDAGIRECYVLQRRAIENYMPARAVEQVTAGRFTGLSEYEALPTDWPKNLDWRIAADSTADELAGNELWEFLDRISTPSFPADT